MSRAWTPDQNNAINAVGGSILVSAAAGSGKTSVLVERVINQITDPLNPTNIDKFLIVTFTKAAAQEMKNRISSRLSEMITKNPENINLQNQQMMLKYSSIGTIHSFCNSIVKENFYKLGISPKFRIADESEISIIKEKAIEKTLNYFYELENPDFIYVSNLFGSEKDDKSLALIINQVYDFTRSLPFPEKWMNEVYEMYKNTSSVKGSPWGKIALTAAKKSLEYVQKIIADTIDISNTNENIKKSYGEALEKDFSEINSIINCLESSTWDEISQKISNFSFSKFKPLKAQNCQFEKNIISEKRKYVKSVIENLQKYFAFSEISTLETVEKFKIISKTLFDITKRFDEEINSLKALRNIADYSDLEHWTVKLLSEESESEIKPSSIACEISNRYSEIMVDEYQDINEIQNTIFKLINSNNKMFCVGDVKQSIYKFRHSKPQIFLKRKDSYPIYSKENNIYPAKIILGKNFRSSEKIIESINFIFKNIMSKDVGEIEYNSEEQLIPGKVSEENSDAGVSFTIIDVSESEENSDILEAYHIAETITEMIYKKYKIYENGTERPVTYGDFCILLRSSNAHAHIYAHELFKQGIPSWSETNEKFLETSEISNIISILQVINNPVQDIPLISSMISPIFGFSVDELAEIRLLDKNSSFYFTVKKAADSGNKKCLEFLNKINYWRQLACTLPCESLIQSIYDETDYPAMCLAQNNGNIKKANLDIFAQYAEKFESQYHKGLSGFLNYIESLKQKKSDLQPASISSEHENTVKIMSIHKSKGLEFPVCIVAGCGKKFNLDTGKVIINPEYGLAMKLKNDEGTLQFDNLIRRSVFSQNQSEDISEEMRILYVALTRAKQKLILIASLKEPQKTVEKNLILTQNNEIISSQTVKNSTSFASWIILCICQSNMRNKFCSLMNLEEYVSEKNSYDSLKWDINLISPKKEEFENDNFDNSDFCENTTTSNENYDSKWREIINQRFHFSYPNKKFINLPLKISASMMNQSGDAEQYIANSQPSFASEKNFTPAERGTALHKFMCFANFKNAKTNGVKNELDYLLKKGFLNSREANVLDINKIKKFMDSDLMQRILNSPKAIREQRFSVKVPPEFLSKEIVCENNYDNFIVMQGAIDCAFLENDEYVIVDYKTDKTENIKELYEKYSTQLKLYKYALEKISPYKVKELAIYSFYLGKTFSEMQ